MATEKGAEEKCRREMVVRWQQKSERERNEGEAACERLERDAARNKGSQRCSSQQRQ